MFATECLDLYVQTTVQTGERIYTRCFYTHLRPTMLAPYNKSHRAYQIGSNISPTPSNTRCRHMQSKKPAKATLRKEPVRILCAAYFRVGHCRNMYSWKAITKSYTNTVRVASCLFLLVTTYVCKNAFPVSCVQKNSRKRARSSTPLLRSSPSPWRRRLRSRSSCSSCSSYFSPS